MTGILDPRIPKVFVCGILITSLPEHCRNNRRFHKQIAVILIAGKISPSLHRAHWVLFAICRYQPIKLPSVRTEHGFSCKIFGYSQGVRWFMKRINLISSSEELHMSIMPSFPLYCFAYTPGASVFFVFLFFFTDNPFGVTWSHHRKSFTREAWAKSCTGTMQCVVNNP